MFSSNDDLTEFSSQLSRESKSNYSKKISEARESRKIFVESQFNRLKELLKRRNTKQADTQLEDKLKAKIDEQNDIIESLNCEKNNEIEFLESFVTTLTEKNFDLQAKLNKSEEIRLQCINEQNQQNQIIEDLKVQLNKFDPLHSINTEIARCNISFIESLKSRDETKQNDECNFGSRKMSYQSQNTSDISCNSFFHCHYAGISANLRKLKSDHINLKKSFTNIQKFFINHLIYTKERYQGSEPTSQETLVRHKCIQNFQENGNVLIWCREFPSKSPTVLSIDACSKIISITLQTGENKKYRYQCDNYIDPTYTQEEIFDAIKPMVQLCFDGYSTCLISYGQSSSGKTFTIEGDEVSLGLIHLIIDYLITFRNADCYLAAIEVYNEKLHDLLNINHDTKLKVKINEKNEFLIPDLTYIKISSVDEARQHINMASGRRTTLRTSYASSRSHCIYEIQLKDKRQGFGSFYLVDLASSERVAKTKADGVHLKEAQMINKSLTSLQEVLYALKNNYSYSLHRNSKLTQTLHSILRGSQIVLMSHVIPDECHTLETMATLNFSQRVRSDSVKCIRQSGSVQSITKLDKKGSKTNLAKLKKESFEQKI